MAIRTRLKKDILVKDEEGTIYIRALALMPSVILCSDGLLLTTFKQKPGDPYLRLDRAITWCEEELKHHSDYIEVLKALKYVANNGVEDV